MMEVSEWVTLGVMLVIGAIIAWRITRIVPPSKVLCYGYQPIGDGRISKVPKNDGSGESKPKTCSHCGKAVK